MVRISGISVFRNKQRAIDIIDIRYVSRDIIAENQLCTIRSDIFFHNRRTCHRNNSAFADLSIAPHPRRFRNFSKSNAKSEIIRLRRRCNNIDVTTIVKLYCSGIIAITTTLDNTFTLNTAIWSANIIRNRRILVIAEPIRDPFLDVSAHVAKVAMKPGIRTNILRFKIRI